MTQTRIPDMATTIEMDITSIVRVEEERDVRHLVLMSVSSVYRIPI